MYVSIRGCDHFTPAVSSLPAHKVFAVPKLGDFTAHHFLPLGATIALDCCGFSIGPPGPSLRKRNSRSDPWDPASAVLTLLAWQSRFCPTSSFLWKLSRRSAEPEVNPWLLSTGCKALPHICWLERVAYISKEVLGILLLTTTDD